MHKSVQGGHLEVVQFLILIGADIDSKDKVSTCNYMLVTPCTCEHILHCIAILIFGSIYNIRNNNIIGVYVRMYNDENHWIHRNKKR